MLSASSPLLALSILAQTGSADSAASTTPTPHWSMVVAFSAATLVLLIASITDVRTQKIPNVLTYPAFVAGFVFWLIVGFTDPPVATEDMAVWHTVSPALLSAAVGFVPCAIIFGLGGLGFGDVKLVTAVGAIFANWQCILMAVFAGFLVAALLSVFVMLRRKLVKQTMGRVYTAALNVLLRAKSSMPDDSPRIPLAVGFLVGGVLAGLEHLLGVPMPWNSVT